VSRYAFISNHRATDAIYSVQRLCRVLQVPRSGFYAWLAGQQRRTARAAADAVLTDQIRAIHAEVGGVYGSPRITVELRAHGQPVNHKRIERLMRQGEIVGVHLRRRRRTTIPDPAAPLAPDLLERDFTATGPDQRWCGDITYLHTGDGWRYLATVIDLHSRRLLGYSIADHLRTDLVIDALNAAVAARGGRVAGVVFHTDRGTQYTSATFAEVCAGHKVRRSMGRIGSSYDNAAAESFFATLKRELGDTWATAQQARLAVLTWIAFYNYRRRHSSLGYRSPVDYETQSVTAANDDVVAA
jgi:transposase InsO family protein